METTSWELLTCDSKALATINTSPAWSARLSMMKPSSPISMQLKKIRVWFFFFKECLTFRRAARGISLNVSTLYSCESKKEGIYTEHIKMWTSWFLCLEFSINFSLSPSFDSLNSALSEITEASLLVVCLRIVHWTNLGGLSIVWSTGRDIYFSVRSKSYYTLTVLTSAMPTLFWSSEMGQG